MLKASLVREAIEWCSQATFKPIINPNVGRYQAYLDRDPRGKALSEKIRAQLFPDRAVILCALKSDPGTLRQALHTDWLLREDDDEPAFGLIALEDETDLIVMSEDGEPCVRRLQMGEVITLPNCMHAGSGLSTGRESPCYRLHFAFRPPDKYVHEIHPAEQKEPWHVPDSAQPSGGGMSDQVQHAIWHGKIWRCLSMDAPPETVWLRDPRLRPTDRLVAGPERDVVRIGTDPQGNPCGFHTVSALPCAQPMATVSFRGWPTFQLPYGHFIGVAGGIEVQNDEKVTVAGRSLQLPVERDGLSITV